MENPPGSGSGSGSSLCRRNRIKKKVEPSLFETSIIMDDLIIEILSRLSTKDVLLSRCVCRRWRDLSSTRDFTDLHFQRSVPMILKYYNGRAMSYRFWEPARTRSSNVHKLYGPYQKGNILFSHNGLIVSNGGVRKRETIVYNPIYCNVVKIVKPCNNSEVYGVFFRPVVKEYCTLWRTTLDVRPLKVQYKILNLESDPKWRNVMNPSNQNAMVPGTRPILIDKYLYWMVEPFQRFGLMYNTGNPTFNLGIMKYDIGKEEFRVITCPVLLSVEKYNDNVYLVDVDGVASLVQAFQGKNTVEISIWTLKDHYEHLWTHSNYTMKPNLYTEYRGYKVVAFSNGELILQVYKTLYVCNLKLGTSREFGRGYHDEVFLSFVPNLVSLRNCKSNIQMMVRVDNDNHEKRGRGVTI